MNHINLKISKQGLLLFAYGSVISIISFLFIFALEYSTNNFSFNTSLSWIKILQATFYCLFVAIIEEYIFRYLFLKRWLTNKSKPFNKNVLLLGLISSLIFGFLHLKLDQFPFFQINITLSGISMFYAAFRFRMISIAIGMHFSWNFIQGVIFPFQGSGSDLESFFIMKNEAMVYPEVSSYIIVSVILEIIIITLLSWVNSSYRAKNDTTNKIFKFGSSSICI